MAQPVDADEATSELELAGAPILSVSQELRRRREALRWSQAEVSRQSGVSRTVVCEVEAGHRVPSLRTYERLARVGLRTFDDGITVSIAPLPGCDDAVRAVAEVEDVATLSDEALAVLMLICVLGEPRRRDLEAYRGEDSASLLDRLRRRGFVEVVGDTGVGIAHRYRITAKVLGALGYPTVEAFRDFCLTVGTLPNRSGPED